MNQNLSGAQFKESRPVVSISSLHYTQHHIGNLVAQSYADYPSSKLPTVYSDEGALYVDDGHHRVEGAKRRGETSIRVRVIGDDGGLLAGVHNPETCPACGGTPKEMP